MSISMQQIDSCIETTINRLSSEAGTMVSNFYLDLRSPGRQRITEKLVEQSINLAGLVVSMLSGKVMGCL